jgi:hypothetical protein
MLLAKRCHFDNNASYLIVLVASSVILPHPADEIEYGYKCPDSIVVTAQCHV